MFDLLAAASGGEPAVDEFAASMTLSDITYKERF
jgi:hypothetical protein